MQGHSRGKVNILGGDTVVLCQKKNVVWTCVYFWMVTGTDLFEYRNTLYSYCYVCSVLYIPFSSCQLALFGYPKWGLSV